MLVGGCAYYPPVTEEPVKVESDGSYYNYDSAYQASRRREYCEANKGATPEMLDAIMSGKIILGMLKSEVAASWGSPDSGDMTKEIVHNSDGRIVFERWSFDNVYKIFVHFEGGVVVTLHDNAESGPTRFLVKPAVEPIRRAHVERRYVRLEKPVYSMPINPEEYERRVRTYLDEHGHLMSVRHQRAFKEGNIMTGMRAEDVEAIWGTPTKRSFVKIPGSDAYHVVWHYPAPMNKLRFTDGYLTSWTE